MKFPRVQLEQLVHGAAKQNATPATTANSAPGVAAQQQIPENTNRVPQVTSEQQSPGNPTDSMNQMSTAPPGTGPPPMLNDATAPDMNQQQPPPEVVQTNGKNLTHASHSNRQNLYEAKPYNFLFWVFYLFLEFAGNIAAAVPNAAVPVNATNMMQPPPNMVPMQHRMPNQFGAPMAAPFGAAPFGMPPPGFQPFGGYGPPQANWGKNFQLILSKKKKQQNKIKKIWKFFMV